jgi:hypothetical protein
MGLLKSIIFWDMTSCSPVSVNRRFGGTYRLHFRVEEISSPRNQVEELISSGWRWRLYVPPKPLLTFNGLHAVISQKMIPFITTAVKTSNTTKWESCFFGELYYVLRYIVGTGQEPLVTQFYKLVVNKSYKSRLQLRKLSCIIPHWFLLYVLAGSETW